MPVWHNNRERRTHIAGEYHIYKEERGVLEDEVRKSDKCDGEELGRLESSENTIPILGDRWWPQTAKKHGDRINQTVFMYYMEDAS